MWVRLLAHLGNPSNAESTRLTLDAFTHTKKKMNHTHKGEENGMAEDPLKVGVSTSLSRRMLCMKRPEVFEVLGQMASGYVCIERGH
jgi:hypothetical protein